MKYNQYIKICVAMLSLLSIGGCGPGDKDKKGRVALKEIPMEYGCAGLTHNEKYLICGTKYGTIVSIDPYTGKASKIYDVDRELGALAYMGNGRYLFERYEYDNYGYPYTFDIHKDLKNTLTRQIGSFSTGGLVYDQTSKLMYGTKGSTIFVRSLNGNFSNEGYSPLGGDNAMAQTDKYIYVVTDYEQAIVQFSKDEIIKSDNRVHPMHSKEIPYKNEGYFDMTFGISGMTIFRGDLFVYYRDGMIHKLDVNLLDYDDSVNVKMRT